MYVCMMPPIQNTYYKPNVDSAPEYSKWAEIDLPPIPRDEATFSGSI